MAILTTLLGGCVSRDAAVIAPAEWSAAGAPLEIMVDEAVTPSDRGESAMQGQAAPLNALPRGMEPETRSRGWRYIVLHHSAAAAGDVASIDAEHRRRRDEFGNPWLGVGYHFVIGNGQPMADGVIEPTFRWREQLHGAHAGSREHNEQGIGVCLVGDFTAAPPTERQLAAARELTAALARRYGVPAERILVHSDVRATDCPGARFPINEIVQAVDPDAAARSTASIAFRTPAAAGGGLDHLDPRERVLRR